MKWMITGGSGFTGQHLLGEIHKKFPEDKIIILDIISPSFGLTNNSKFIQVDLLNEDEVQKILVRENPQKIIHLVGLKNNKNPLLMAKINVVTCGILLDTINKQEIPINGLLVIGSVAQYGDANPDNPPSEEIPCNPNTYYGYLKFLQEKLAMEYYHNYSIPVICVRPANLIGPNMPTTFIVPHIIKQLMVKKVKNKTTKQELTINHINAGRDFIDVRDISNAYIQLFDNFETRGEIFNIGNGELITLPEIIIKIRDLLAIENLEIKEKKPRKDFDNHLTNCFKIQKFIQWKPKFDLEKTLVDMIEAYRQELSINMNF